MNDVHILSDCHMFVILLYCDFVGGSKVPPVLYIQYTLSMPNMANIGHSILAIKHTHT